MNYGQHGGRSTGFKAESSIEKEITPEATLESDENGHNQPVFTLNKPKFVDHTDPSSHCMVTQADDDSIWPQGCVAQNPNGVVNDEGQEVDDDGEVLHKRLCHLENET